MTRLAVAVVVAAVVLTAAAAAHPLSPSLTFVP